MGKRLAAKAAARENWTVQEMTTMALLAALLCVSSYISFQLPISAVPITAQTLIINLIALLLKPKKAGITVGVWILLGLAGLPVFSGGRGGIGVLAGATGGYIIGQLIAAVIIPAIRGKKNHIFRSAICLIAVGIPVIYIVGVPWMQAVTGIDLHAALITGVLPFLPGDIIKCIAAVAVSKPLYRVVNARQ